MEVEDKPAINEREARRKKGERKRRVSRHSATEDDDASGQKIRSSRRSRPTSATEPRPKKSKKSKPLPPSIFDHVQKRPEDFENCVTKVMIHGTDELDPDLNVSRPVVRVSFVDIQTGCYISKQSPTRPATTYHEPPHVDYILPTMTKRYAPSPQTPHTSSTSPKWEEPLLINEDYLYLVDNPNTLVLFEILDLGKGAERVHGKESQGWYRVAWGFLRPLNGVGRTNTEVKVRLQLFQYPTTPSSTTQNIIEVLHNVAEAPDGGTPLVTTPQYPKLVPEIWRIWNNTKRKKYPSTLYVTISAVPGATDRYVTHRPRSVCEVEKGKLTLEQLLALHDARQRSADNDMGRSCVDLNFNEGRVLSPLFTKRTIPSRRIYRVVDGMRAGVCVGHVGMVYQVVWDEEGKLYSASADGSVRVWAFDPVESPPVRLEAVMQHPGYVYSVAVHHADDSSIVATASSDTLVRLYTDIPSFSPSPESLQPFQVLRGHNAPLNTIAFGKGGKRLYSGDTEGVIKVWSLEEREEDVGGRKRRSKGRVRGRKYVLLQSVTVFQSLKVVLELIDVSASHKKGTSITSLTLHPSTRKLLVRTAFPIPSFGITSNLHILDTRIHRILTSYSPIIPTDLTSPPTSTASATLLRATTTPCGTYVLEGHQNGSIGVWRTEMEES
ncbi:Jouberin, partial [Rhizophlyctis rosea]